MPDPVLDESALSAFRHRADGVVSDGLRALADGLARSAELSQQAVEARAESEEQRAALRERQERRRAESPASD